MALAQRFSTNPQSTNGSASGVNLSMNDIFPIQPISKGLGVDDEKVTLQQIQSIPYGTASLSGTTYTVSFANYPTDFNVSIGQKILVKFNSAKSGNDSLNLSINGQLIPMLMQGSALKEIAENQIIEFTMIGNIVNGTQTITGANASAGVTESKVNNQINGALAYQTKTNANACIPTTEGKTEQFQVNNANDTPDKRPCIIVAKMEKQTSYYNLYQELISYDANSKVVKYIRYGYSTNKNNWTFGNWEKLVTENEERQNYNHVNTSYNSEYINTFNFKLVKKNGILIINIENLSFKKSGINVSNVITGLPPIKDRVTIQISDCNGHTGMLRYENNGSILMIWNSNSTDEVSGNAVGLVA